MEHQAATRWLHGEKQGGSDYEAQPKGHQAKSKCFENKG